VPDAEAQDWAQMGGYLLSYRDYLATNSDYDISQYDWTTDKLMDNYDKESGMITIKSLSEDVEDLLIPITSLLSMPTLTDIMNNPE